MALAEAQNELLQTLSTTMFSSSFKIDKLRIQLWLIEKLMLLSDTYSKGS